MMKWPSRLHHAALRAAFWILPVTGSHAQNFDGCQGDQSVNYYIDAIFLGDLGTNWVANPIQYSIGGTALYNANTNGTDCAIVAAPGPTSTIPISVPIHTGQGTANTLSLTVYGAGCPCRQLTTGHWNVIATQVAYSWSDGSPGGTVTVKHPESSSNGLGFLTTFSGIQITPTTVGLVTLNLTFEVTTKEHGTITMPTIAMPVYLTLYPSAAALAPVLSTNMTFYSLACGFASGLSDESAIMGALTSGVYHYGGAHHWKYAHCALCTLTWQDLLLNNPGDCPILCGICGSFAEVGLNLAQILGVPDVTQTGFWQPLVTHPGIRSIDPAFVGNVASREIMITNCLGAPPEDLPFYDRYFFGNHLFLQQGSSYYDPTFNQTYASPADCAYWTFKGRLGPTTPPGYSVWQATSRSAYYPITNDCSSAIWGNYYFVTNPPGDSPTALASSSRMDVPESARIEGVDRDQDGLAERLRVEFDVSASDGDNLIAHAAMYDPAGAVVARSPSWGSPALPVAEALPREGGRQTLRLEFSGEEIFLSGYDGPVVCRGWLVNQTGARKEFSIRSAGAVRHQEFGERPALLDDAADWPSHLALDPMNGERLAWAPVHVRKPGTYHLQASLSAEGRMRGASGRGITFAQPGVFPVELRFPEWKGETRVGETLRLAVVLSDAALRHLDSKRLSLGK